MSNEYADADRNPDADTYANAPPESDAHTNANDHTNAIAEPDGNALLRDAVTNEDANADAYAMRGVLRVQHVFRDGFSHQRGV